MVVHGRLRNGRIEPSGLGAPGLDGQAHVKAAVYSGTIVARQRHGRGRQKYLVRGRGADQRTLTVVCRLTASDLLRVITVFAS